MKYNFTAKGIDGKIVSGIITAESKDIALKMLQEKSLEVISLISKTDINSLNVDIVKVMGMEKFVSVFESVSSKNIVNFSKQMSALLDAGVSILKALQIMLQDEKNTLMIKVLENVIQEVKSGKSISVAFSKHKNVFSDFYTNLIKSGEESGKMSQAFAYLSEYLDRNYVLASKVKNAMIYPGFVIAIFFTVMILIFTLVIPGMATILKESNVELPALTIIVLAISDFLIAYGIYFFILITVFGIYAYFSLRNTNGWVLFFDTIKIKTPILKNVFKMLYVTRIADNIQTLLSSGVSLTKSIQITADVVGNIHYKKILENSLLDVRSGVSFSKSLEKHKELMPNTLIQMLRIGEETGEISKLMGNIAKFYQREINTSVDTMVGLIEPLMIVLLGLGVGTLLISVLMPIYNLAGAF